MDVMAKQYWWESGDEKLYQDVFETVKYLRNKQSLRRQMNSRHMMLYSNFDELATSNIMADIGVRQSSESKLKLNIVQSCCDTITAKIVKNRPKPTFLTSGGTYSEQKKAKLADKFIDGLFYDVDFKDLARKSFLDSTVFGTGGIKWYLDPVEKKLCAERVFIDEIVIDDDEAVYGKPMQLHQVKTIGRDVLAGMYPDEAPKIATCGRYDENATTSDRVVDRVTVIESWRLPTTTDNTDGKHTITIDNCTLLSEGWELDRFPFVFMKWAERLLGFFGQGLAEQLTGVQYEVNKLLRTIQLSMHLNSVPRWWIEKGSGVVKAHMNDKIGALVTFKGTPPILHASNAVPTELREHLEYLIGRAYEITGISQLSASSRKPSGLSSGRALIEYHDIETERFAVIGQVWEDFHIDNAKVALAMIKRVKEQEEVGDYEVKIEDKKHLRKVKWSELDLDEDSYVLKIFPTSFLPQTPSGRLEKVEQMIQAGFITQDDAMDLLDFPDLEAVTSLQTAGVRELNEVIEIMIDTGEYVPPEPYQNLQLGLRKVQKAYLKAKMDKVPENRLELLRRWLDDAAAKIQQAQQPMAPPVQELPQAPEPEMGAGDNQNVIGG